MIMQNKKLKPRQLSAEEKWENATIANNFIFYKVMRHNPDVCKRLIEILLEIEIDHIELANEETIQIDFGRKGVRLDVYAKNTDKSFCLEMQTADTGELPERARYYQSAIDVDCLNTGQNYQNLPDSYVIFICVDDIFKKGLAKYEFENLCTGDTSIKLNDRTYKHFFIAKNCDKILSNEEQKAFLKMVIQNESKSPFTDKLKNLVNNAKQNTQWKRQFMDLEREKRFAYQDGKKDGAYDKAVETATNLLKMKIGTTEQIASATGLSIEDVKELEEDI